MADINSYYSRPNYQPQSQFQSPGRSSPMAWDPNAIRRQPTQAPGIASDSQRYGDPYVMDPARITPRADPEAQRQWASRNVRPPDWSPVIAEKDRGNLDPDTFRKLNAVYVRHYMAGTYGSPEMMNEVRQLLDAVDQRREMEAKYVRDSEAEIARKNAEDERRRVLAQRQTATDGMMGRIWRRDVPQQGSVTVPQRGGAGGLGPWGVKGS